jgi:hypothetical protein
MISKIADNYARLRRLNNLANKAGLIFTKQGPVALFKKVLSFHPFCNKLFLYWVTF